MSAPLIPGHCPNVTSVAGTTGHTVIQSGTTAQGGSQSLTGASLAQEARLGHILVPSNTWNSEALAPFRLQANNPGSTDFSKLKSPQKQSTTVCQQRKKNTSQPGPETQVLPQRGDSATKGRVQKMATEATPVAPSKAHKACPGGQAICLSGRSMEARVGHFILLCLGFKGAQGSSPHTSSWLQTGRPPHAGLSKEKEGA